jgi:hypothetical protein
MEFRLTYRGPLPPETSSPRVKYKRRLRSYFHHQLKTLVQTHPSLSHRNSLYWIWPQGHAEEVDSPNTEISVYWDDIATRNTVLTKGNHAHRFAPLIVEENYDSCSLDILFLRRDMKGSIVKYQGDIDNRLKVLFDGLTKPQGSGLEDIPQRADENPCFCLLEDDKFIDRMSVTTDRLLTPLDGEESEHDVVLIITVTASLFNRTSDFSAS